MDQMRTLKQRLMSLDKDIRVGIVGVGSAGKGLCYQVNITPGMRPAAIADIEIQKAIECAKWLKIDYEVVKTVADLNYVVQCGKLAITDNADLIASSGLIHVFVEATSSAFQGAIHGLKAIRSRQHVVMMNYDADLLYGSVLFTSAQEEGVVYTCCDGDQSAAIKKLYDEIEFCGLNIVMVGAIKNYLDRHTDPVKIASQAEQRHLNPKICSSFTDGTKLNVNMSVVANSINGIVLTPGMLGHAMTQINDIFRHVNFDDIWNGRSPIVDYVLGSEPKGGVFLIARANDSFQRQSLEWLPAGFGKGPYYLFSRSYSLGYLEAMHCIGEAYLESTARLQPKAGNRTSVISYAKRNLKQGERLDGPGGFQSYGLIENVNEESNDGLPILLNDNLKLKRNVNRDERITLNDVEFNEEDPAFSLYFQAMELSKLRHSSKVRRVIPEYVPMPK